MIAHRSGYMSSRTHPLKLVTIMSRPPLWYLIAQDGGPLLITCQLLIILIFYDKTESTETRAKGGPALSTKLISKGCTLCASTHHVTSMQGRTARGV